jgi:DNA-nicking Smr family endonuclease
MPGTPKRNRKKTLVKSRMRRLSQLVQMTLHQLRLANARQILLAFLRLPMALAHEASAFVLATQSLNQVLEVTASHRKPVGS